MQARIPHGHQQAAQPTMEHAMMAARARVLSRPGTDKLRQWSRQPQMPEFAQLSAIDQAGQLYGAVLSQIQLKDWEAARQAWAQLGRHAQAQGDRAAQQQVRWLGAELELSAQQPQAALRALGDTNLRGDVPRPQLLLAGQSLLATGQAQPVAERLQTWVVTHPHDAAAWRLLSQAWQAQHQTLRAIRAEAEAHAAHYDYAAAVDRFKAGQDAARRSQGAADYIEVSIIDTRLRAVEALLREQAREK